MSNRENDLNTPENRDIGRPRRNKNRKPTLRLPNAVENHESAPSTSLRRPPAGPEPAPTPEATGRYSRYFENNDVDASPVDTSPRDAGGDTRLSSPRRAENGHAFRAPARRDAATRDKPSSPVTDPFERPLSEDDNGATRRTPSHSDNGSPNRSQVLPEAHPNADDLAAAEQLREDVDLFLNDPKFRAYRHDLRKRVNGKPTRSSSVVSVPQAMMSGVKKTLISVLVIFLAVILFIVSAGFGVTSGYLSTAKPFEIVDIKKTYDATYLYDRNGNVAAKLSGSQNMLREYVPFEKFHNTYIDDAFIAIEDERFETHNGIDPKRIASAMVGLLINFGGDAPSHGGSTITQQVVKMMSGANERSAQRKIQEWERAVALEKNLSKDKIMELFVNIVPMSNNFVGVQAASKAYFGKDISELDLAECAFLAGIPNVPAIYNPWTEYGKRNTLRRMRSTLNKMLELGKITREEYETAINRELVILPPKKEETASEIYSYFTEAVIDQVRAELIAKRGYSPTLADIAIFQQGLHIETTLDPEIQKMAERSFMKKELMMTDYNAMPDMPQKPQAAITVISNQPESRGQVVALVGGLGEKKDNFGFNRATRSYRQPGSVIKPILDYAPALDQGIITAATVLVDEPKFFDPHNPDVEWPNNSGRIHRGPISVRTAIRLSVNTIAVEVYYKMLTPQLGLSYMKRLGIDRTNETQPAGAIGAFSKGMTSMELAGAYTALANDGLFTEPYLFTRVLDADGNILLEHTPTFEQVFRAETADIMTDILVDTVQNASWIAPYVRLDNQVVAGKTGTTDERNDRTFAGYTPYYTAAVWYGYDNAHGRWTEIPLEDTKMPLLLWKDVMAQIHENLPPREFEMSSNVIRQTICSDSGLIASEWCPHKYTELFDATNGSAPRIVCPLHAAPRPTEPPAPTNVEPPAPSPTETPTDPAPPPTDPD